MAKALLQRLERECGMTMLKVNAESALSLPDPEHFAKEGRPTEENLDNIKVTSQGDGGTSAAYLAARLKKAGRDDLLKQIGPDKPFVLFALLVERFSPHGLDASNDVPVHCLGNHQQGADVGEHHHQSDAPRCNSFA